METFETIHPSPLGTLRITCSDSAIHSVLFLNQEAEGPTMPEHPLLRLCGEQLDAHFSGQLQSFDPPLAQTGTPFQQKVWALLSQIPYGKTLSYQTLSRQYGDLKAIRAIASANGRNNIAIIVPCHRVIGSNQSLTGYAGGLWRKQWLLEHEARHSSGVQQLF